MPALHAACFNPDPKAKYQQLIATGKSAEIAITAVMRKLVITAIPAQSRPTLDAGTRLDITDTLKALVVMFVVAFAGIKRSCDMGLR